jgi:hypothetical protein
MKSKSIKRKTRKPRKNMMINSKTLKSIKSVKKYTYKNKGGAPLLILGKLAGKAGAKAAGFAARKGAAVARVAASAAAKQVAKQVAKQAAKQVAKQAARQVAKQAARQVSKEAKSMMKDTLPNNKPNNKPINKPINNSLEPRKAVHNKNSETYLCDPTNFEIVLPLTHKSSSSIIGKKNDTYYEINIPKDTKAGSRVRFKDKLIIKNVGQNPPNCDKQTLNIVNHIPTPGSGINENPNTAPKKTTNVKPAPGQYINDNLKNTVSQVLSRTNLSIPKISMNGARQQLLSRRLSMTENPMMDQHQLRPGIQKHNTPKSRSTRRRRR